MAATTRAGAPPTAAEEEEEGRGPPALGRWCSGPRGGAPCSPWPRSRVGGTGSSRKEEEEEAGAAAGAAEGAARSPVQLPLLPLPLSPPAPPEPRAQRSRGRPPCWCSLPWGGERPRSAATARALWPEEQDEEKLLPSSLLPATTTTPPRPSCDGWQRPGRPLSRAASCLGSSEGTSP